MADSLSRFSGRRSPRSGFRSKNRQPSAKVDFLAWSIFIVLLVGLVLLCWMGTYYVFTHPENPTSYAILQKMKKVEPPERFLITEAPKGEFLTGEKILERYDALSDRELKKESDKLLRNYIRNYDQTQDLVPYVYGRFNILDSYQLSANDFFTSGVVALAQDNENPKLLIEHIYPSESDPTTLHRMLLTGVDIPIQKTLDLTAVTGVERLADGRIKLTVVPIHYPDYTSTESTATFRLEPPKRLNVEAGLPVLGKDRIEDADARYAFHRRKAGLTAGSSGDTPPTSPELIRIQPATSLTGETPAPEPTEAVAATSEDPATPPPATTETAANDAPQIVGVGEDEPHVLPAIPVNEASPDTPLKPFNSSGNDRPAVANTAAGEWPVYEPGRMPRGRLVGVNETVDMVDADPTGQPVYLRGDFTVTASAQSRAVLRSASGDSADTARVIVEFPSNSRPPSEGSSVNRGPDRPFLITNVRKTDDGQINIYVREVISE